MRLQPTVRRLVIEATIRVSTIPLGYALPVPKIKVFHTKLRILDFDSPINAGDLSNFIRSRSIHIGLVSAKQTGQQTHKSSIGCTHIPPFSASESCTTVLLDIRDHISPTSQFLWDGGVGNVFVQLHGVKNLGRYHVWRWEVFWAVGNEGFGPGG